MLKYTKRSLEPETPPGNKGIITNDVLYKEGLRRTEGVFLLSKLRNTDMNSTLL